LKVLFIGDIIGEPGRKMLKQALPDLLKAHVPDLVIANGENAAGGFGITPEIAEELFSLGIHVLTSGNHVWDKKEIEPWLGKQDHLIRPANYPAETPGSGSVVVSSDRGKVAVLNLEGRVFMSPLEDPFRVAEREVERLRKETRTIIVDFHAEATSEKQAMGWYLDGRVSAVVGAHTHVQTADERLLPRGTAFITDSGMTGPHDSVIGSVPDLALDRFLRQIPVRLEPASANLRICGVLIDIDESTGRATAIQRLNLPFTL